MAGKIHNISAELAALPGGDPPSLTQDIDKPSLVHRVIATRDVRMVYQPVVNLVTREIFAYEALVRTRHYPSPVELFEAAVEANVVGQLGRTLRSIAVESCPNHPLF